MYHHSMHLLFIESSNFYKYCYAYSLAVSVVVFVGVIFRFFVTGITLTGVVELSGAPKPTVVLDISEPTPFDFIVASSNPIVDTGKAGVAPNATVVTLWVNAVCFCCSAQKLSRKPSTCQKHSKTLEL